MNTQLLPENHFTLSVVADVKAICESLKKYGISFFAYMRCYHDDTVYGLMTDKDIQYHHFQQEYLIAPHVPENLITDKFHYLAFPDNASTRFNQAYYEYQNKFQLAHPIYLFERDKGYVDIFVYTASKNDFTIINFYLNKMEILESFKSYFRDKAAKIIKKADRNKIIIPSHMRLNFSGLSDNGEERENIRLLKEKVRDINLRLQFHFNTKLTVRELQSISYLLKGRTATETSKALNISPKTVEFYIGSAKTKLNCLTRADIFDKALETNLIKIITKL